MRVECSVNQRLPSGPVVMAMGWLLATMRGNAVMTPSGVMRPMKLPRRAVNHRLLSGPVVIASGSVILAELPTGLGMANSDAAPVGLMRPILSDVPPVVLVYQKLPSGPGVRPSKLPFTVGTANS